MTKNDINKLKDDISQLEYNDEITLDKIIRKIRIILDNHFGESFIDDFKSISFKPSGTYLPNDHFKIKKESWHIGKEKMSNLLDAMLDDLSQKTNILNDNVFISIQIINELKSITNNNFDLIKLVKFCEETNENFKSNNILSVSLLLRAIINYVPPIFGKTAFNQVSSNMGRSLKAIFEQLENNFRKIADMHTHLPIKKNETLPSKNQIEPFKPNFEILLQNIITRMKINT